MNFGDGSKIDLMMMCIYVLLLMFGVDYVLGLIMCIGNLFDVVVQGLGWLLVQMVDGSEVYMCVGNLYVDENGQFVNVSNLLVIGNGGLILVLLNVEVMIGKDGMVFVLMLGDLLMVVVIVDQMKFVNFDLVMFMCGNDGLFCIVDGNLVDVDLNVVVMLNLFEGSNVNLVIVMVVMIDNVWVFQLQLKLIQMVDQNEQMVNQLFNFS